MEQDSRTNPFDFHLPVRTAAELVGRRREVRWLAEAIAGAEAGRPVHALVIGARGGGKTSLLNAFAAEARRTGALPISVRLNDSVVTSPEPFFDAILTATMIALAKSKILEADDERFLTWRQQVGRVDHASPFLLSYAQPYCDTAALVSDLTSLRDLASLNDRGSMLLLVDDADLLRDDQVIYQALEALLDQLDGWTLVLSGGRQSS